MSTNKPTLVSGRVPVTDYGNLSADRYEFLGLNQAEPNLGPGNANSVLTLESGNTRAWTNSLTLQSVSVTGNISAGNVLVGNILIPATGNINVGGTWINNLVDPIQPQDAATKHYVDIVAQGLDPKASVVLSSSVALPAYIYDNGTDGVGATLTAQTVGVLSLDGIDVEADQRVLIKNETGAYVSDTAMSAAFNGIYVVVNPGSVTDEYVLIRAADFDQGVEMPGAFTFVETGDTLADTGWVCTSNNPIVVGTTEIIWTQFSGAGSYQAGNGLTLVGTVFNVNVDPNTTEINGNNQVAVKASANLVTPNIGNAIGNSLSVTGNISGNYIFGNGASLTGLQSFIGATGASGIQGNIGATGASGIQGEIGATGASGIQGEIGATGASGLVGSTGYIGATGASGLVGTTGYTGATGASGLVGSTGYIGATGASGLDGTTGYTGATGASGLVGSTGYIGATGASGLVGATGASGIQGEIGATGASGIQGEIGATGASGIQGEIGATGASGIQGEIGATGASGIQGEIGATGASGIQGEIGATGASGIQGEIGATGASGLVGATGDIGSTGASGLTGTTGYTGATGASGLVGSTGYIGATGASGLTGTTGYTGATGASGLVGATGASGLDGATGATGLTGSTGVAGTSVSIIGSVTDVNDTYPGGGPNDPQGYLNYYFPSAVTGNGVIDQASGNLWVYTGGGVWTDVGQIVGPQGATGTIGATGASGIQGEIGATGASGLVGTTGYTGATGASGLVGSTGYIGATGASGLTGTTGYTGATGASGLVGATGDIGSTGASGLVGATGASGIQGEIGATGASGIQGEIGATGASGIQGEIGATGASGIQGEIGATGASGLAGTTGATGASGLAGTTGATGASGIQGEIGATGASGLVGSTGYIGATGASGLDGTTGYTGATGASGLVGSTGYIGATGASGLDGTTGYTGATGASGLVGSTGYIGATGASGLAGTTGATGASGIQGEIGATGASGLVGATGASGLVGTTGYTGATGASGLTGATGSFNGNLLANVDGNGYNISNISFLSATGNISGSYIVGNGSTLTGVNFSQLADANTALLTINDVYLQGVTNLAVNHTGATAYTFDQYPGSNPTLYAVAGTTLAFDLTTSGHPFQIQDSGGVDYNTGLYHVTSAGVVSTGLAAQGKTSGTLYWKIPSDIYGNYKYQCANHPVMVGNIVIQDSNISNAVGNVISTYSGNITANNFSATGNITAATVSTTGNITGNYILGNGASLTGVITSVANINNGTSNITVVSSGGNITVGIGGTGNVAVFATTGEYVTGVVSATGNITGNYIVGNGSTLTGVNFSQLADANTAGLTINDVYLQGVTNLAVNHTGATAYTFDQYPGSNPSLYAVAGTTLAFDLTTSGHPFQIQDSGGVDYNTGLYHVTSTGVVSTGVSAQGKTSGTLYWKIPADIYGNYKYQCANHPVMVGNIIIQPANFANALSTYTGNISASNISASGNITAANVNTANLSLSGNVISDFNITGNINANNANFGNAYASGNVTFPTQLATKQYVDNAVSSGLHIHEAVLVSTTANLIATYTPGGTTPTITAISGGNLLTSVGSNLSIDEEVTFGSTTNGLTAGVSYFVYSAPSADTFTLTASWQGPQITTLVDGTGLSITSTANPGVGAYLTNAGTQAALVIDSIPMAVTNRVLVQFQTNAAVNGVYVVSNIGSISTNWVMTRAADASVYYPQSDFGIGEGDYFFVQSGNTLGGDSYVLTTAGVISVGTTPLIYSQFSGAVNYTGVSPVVVTGQSISLANLTGTGDTVVLNNTPVLIAPDLGNATGNSVSVSGNVTGNQVISIVSTGTAPLSVTSTTRVTNLNAERAGVSDTSDVTFTAANIQYPTFAYAGLTGTYRLESNTAFSANFANGAFSAVTFTGNLTGTTASLVGNVTGGNLLTGGLISATSTITSAANITGANLLTGGLISATSTITSAANITGANLLTAGLISATSTITSAANITGANILTGGLVSATSNVTGGNITTSGQLITTVAIGTAPLVVTSNTRVANLNVASAGISDRSNVTFAAANIQYPTFAYANITGTYPLESNIAFSANFANGGFSATIFSGNLIGTTASLSGNVTGGNILTAGVMSSTGNAIAGNVLTGGLISATSTITSAANITGANLLTGGQVSATGNITTAGYFVGTFAGSISGNVTAPGANTQVIYNNSGNLAASAGFTFNQASNALVVTGNITGTLISATGNIDAAGNLLADGYVSAVGNVTGGNVTTTGLVTATGNIQGGNIRTVGLVSATGNVTGGNVITAGQVSAVGNISVGNAAAVTWANATGTRAYTYYNNATGSLDTVFI